MVKDLISSWRPINLYLLVELQKQTFMQSCFAACSSVMHCLFVFRAPPIVLLLCSFIVVAGDQKQRGEMSHVLCIHPKWRSYGLVKGQKKSKGEEKRRKKWELFPELSLVDELNVPMFQYWISSGSNADFRSVPA